MINFRDELIYARSYLEKKKKNPLTHILKTGRDLKYRKFISV